MSSPVSLRKVTANRQNALKSSGPKTARGKTFSRMNAWKHRLFGQLSDFQALGENPWEYSDLREGLRKQFQPIGSAEELKVERIAQCWWRLKTGLPRPVTLMSAQPDVDADPRSVDINAIVQKFRLRQIEVRYMHVMHAGLKSIPRIKVVSHSTA